MKKNKLIHGIGVNDADYPVYKMGKVDGKRKILWVCPFYVKWTSMLDRCYSKKTIHKYPSYTKCSVVPEWHYFSQFKVWMETQDWEGKHLDKDLLLKGNKVYGPDTCLFIEAELNSFILEPTKKSTNLPIGVFKSKNSDKYEARCNNGVKCIYLGSFETIEKAHNAWLTFKLEQANIIAQKQTDQRISKALIERYENYEDSRFRVI